MAFELYEKREIGRVLPPKVISIGKTTISCGCEIADDLKDKGFVEIYLDRKNKRIGLKPSKDNIKGFKIGDKSRKGKSTYLAATSLTKRVPTGRYKANKEEGLWVIKVPEIAEHER